MITKRINEKSAKIIEQYRDVPYFNNRRTNLRNALPVNIGKGSPKEIHDELDFIIKRDHLDKNNIDVKKVLVENNIGIDCSGFIYHVLQKTNYSFPYAKNFFKKLIAKLRPSANINVKTIAHDANSKVINLKDVEPGDIITMTSEDATFRNHIMVIEQIEYQNSIPATLHYVHTIAIPEDGEYNHGIHRGNIEIINSEKPITQQVWSEKYLLDRALQMRCELRRVVVS